MIKKKTIKELKWGKVEDYDENIIMNYDENSGMKNLWYDI